jgi:plastocyanin
VAERERTPHAATQALGMTLIASAMLVVTVLTLVVFEGEDIAPFAIGVVVASAIAWVTWRYDRAWSQVLGIVGALLAGLTAFFLAFGVFQPFSPLEFIVGLVFLLGFFMALVAGIMALIARRSGPTPPRPREVRFRQSVLGLIGVAAVVSIVGFLVTRTTVSDEEAGEATAVEMTDFEFDPVSTVASAQDGILMVNNDAFAHDFTLDEFDIYVHLGPGSEAIVDLSSLPPGTYDYYCSLHSDGVDGMIGTIEVDA